MRTLPALLPLSLMDPPHGVTSFALVLRACLRKAYTDLQHLTEELPGKSDNSRKLRLLDYLCRTKQVHYYRAHLFRNTFSLIPSSYIASYSRSPECWYCSTGLDNPLFSKYSELALSYMYVTVNQSSILSTCVC